MMQLTSLRSQKYQPESRASTTDSIQPDVALARHYQYPRCRESIHYQQQLQFDRSMGCSNGKRRGLYYANTNEQSFVNLIDLNSRFWILTK